MCTEGSNRGWPPPPHCATISCVALSTSASSAARDRIQFVWYSSKGKSNGSDHSLPKRRYINLVCVLRRSNWGWPPPPHWAIISCVALSTSASSAASDQITCVWDGSKRKSTGSDHPVSWRRHNNLVCVLRRSNWGWPPAPHWDIISCVALSTSASSAASDRITCVWDGSKRKSTGSDHPVSWRRHGNPVCVLRRSNLILPPAPHWDIISCVALSTSASSAASDQITFVWFSSKRKSTGSDHSLSWRRHGNLVCVLRRSNLIWPPAPHWAIISCVALSTSASSAASDQITFVWFSSKRKSTGSDHPLSWRRHNNLV
jgi:hypothetical protein